MGQPTDAGWFLDEYDGPRFWQHVDFHGGTAHLDDPLSTAQGECWMWTGWAAGSGTRYGRFRLHGIGTPAHRIAYRDFGHKLPDDLHIDHLCRNTRCVNPAHLEAVTRQENVGRGLRGVRNVTHCPSGHEYDEANTRYQNHGGKRIRLCRACLREQRHAQYVARKQSA